MKRIRILPWVRFFVSLAALGLILGCPSRRQVLAEDDDLLFENPLAGVRIEIDAKSQQLFDEGWGFFEQGHAERARDYFKEAISHEKSLGHDDRVYPFLTALAYCSYSLRMFEHAEGYFRRALAIQPRYYQALAGMATMYQKKGEALRAYNLFEKALQVNPNGRSARMGLNITKLKISETGLMTARRLASEGALNEAIEHYNRVLTVAPELTEVHLEIAGLFERAGRFEEAVGAYKKGVEGDPENIDLLLQLGGLLERIDDSAGAVSAYARVIKLDPTNEQAKEAYKRALISERSRNLPAELTNLSDASVVKRAQVAALLSHKLPLYRRTRARNQEAVIIVDIGSSWAKRYIQEVVASGLMDVYDNHTFKPEKSLTRMDMASISGRVLSRFVEDGIIHESRSRQIRIRDIPPEHLMHDVIQEVVERQIMSLSHENRFSPSHPITGKEAVSTIERLVMLIR
ncbi:S-layer homology domain-containing protein [Acidobacteriota bacterium]